LSAQDLIQPIFVKEGLTGRREIASMRGQYQFSMPEAVNEAGQIAALGVPAVILFGIPAKKDKTGKIAMSKNGIVQKTIQAIKKKHVDIASGKAELQILGRDEVLEFCRYMAYMMPKHTLFQRIIGTGEYVPVPPALFPYRLDVFVRAYPEFVGRFRIRKRIPKILHHRYIRPYEIDDVLHLPFAEVVGLHHRAVPMHHLRSVLEADERFRRNDRLEVVAKRVAHTSIRATGRNGRQIAFALYML
jgi:hypothetical protein